MQRSKGVYNSLRKSPEFKQKTLKVAVDCTGVSDIYSPGKFKNLMPSCFHEAICDGEKARFKFELKMMRLPLRVFESKRNKLAILKCFFPSKVSDLYFAITKLQGKRFDGSKPSNLDFL